MGLRIAQISQECSVNGGIGAYVTDLCETLASAGHDVTHVHADMGPFVQPSDRVRRYCVAHFDEFAELSTCRRRADQVLEILDSVQPDIVHVQNNNNFVLEKDLRDRFPTVKSLHDYDFCPSGNKFHHALGRHCDHSTGPLCVARMGYKRCTLSKRPWVIWNRYRRCVEANRNNAQYDRLIVASQYVKEQAVATGYSPSKIEVLPYFVHPLDSVRSRSSDDRTLLFVGRVTREKGVDVLLRVLARMRVPARLLIAGNGGDWNRTKRMAGRLGVADRSEFLGWVQACELPGLYAVSSVVVMPSLWAEPFGIAGIEAMNYGRPVVAFRVGGIPEWLSNGITGFTVRPYDVDEMADRLSYLLDHPRVAQEMGQRGKTSVESNYNPDRHVSGLIGIFRNIIDARARTASCIG